ncbi:MAG: hypothetical protein M9962_13820 [Oligoflexia bacterium]|nr:hypothetical protein [Oligoflexia bacterium]
MNQDQFWWYSRSEPSIVYGSVKYLEKIIGMEVDAKELVSRLLPRFFFERFQVGTGKQAVMKKGKDTTTIEWSDRLWEVVGWVKESGDKKSQIQYENYSVKFGLSYPQKIRMLSYLGKQELQNLTWAWKDWRPEVSKNEKLFLVPQPETFGKPIKALP